jgi:hypothetical protein
MCVSFALLVFFLRKHSTKNEKYILHTTKNVRILFGCVLHHHMWDLKTAYWVLIFTRTWRFCTCTEIRPFVSSTIHKKHAHIRVQMKNAHKLLTHTHTSKFVCEQRISISFRVCSINTKSVFSACSVLFFVVHMAYDISSALPFITSRWCTLLHRNI